MKNRAMKDRPWSLRGRLIVGLSIVLVLGSLIPVLAVIISSKKSIDTMHDRALQDQAADIVRGIDPVSNTFDLPAGLDAAYAQSNDGFLYAVFAADGSVIASSSPAAADILKGAIRHGPDKFQVLRPVGSAGPWYAYVEPAGAFKVAVAQSGLHDDVLADSVVGELARESTPVLLAVMFVGIAVVWITLRQAFKQINRAALIAEQMRPGDGVPLESQGMPVEIRPFVDSVASAMTRLEDALNTERRFLANAAHEIRTPLSILTARIDRLPQSADRLALARDADRLNRLVAQLLEAARLDADTLNLDSKFDLQQVVVETVADLAPLAVKDEREIAISKFDGPVFVQGDPHGISLALRNLIENALKHTPRGGEIDIAFEAPARVHVKDRGPGIPEADRGRLFERFQRGKTSAAGSGLGLSIVQEILRQHGGTVDIENRPDGGADISFALPAERVLR